MTKDSWTGYCLHGRHAELAAGLHLVGRVHVQAARLSDEGDEVVVFNGEVEVADLAALTDAVLKAGEAN